MTDPALRETILADEEIIASRRRFGLFSQPPPLAIGDDTLFPIKKPHKGQDGKPITSPRNLLGGMNRTGVGKRSYLQVPSSIYQSDEYMDVFKRELKYENTMHSKGNMHQMDFKPASGFKTLAKSAYNYVQEKPELKKQSKRDKDGRVMTEPANIVTNQTSTVEYRYMKHPNYIADPYYRKDELARQDREQWRKKLGEVSFKSMNGGCKSFTKDRIQYGIDDKTKSLMQAKKSNVTTRINTVQHDAKFKPAIRGHGEPIGKFPGYVSPAQIPKTRVKTQGKDDNSKEEFKLSAPLALSRPTPSISLNPKNLHLARRR